VTTDPERDAALDWPRQELDRIKASCWESDLTNPSGRRINWF
jgi:hypothetical protein